MKVIKYIPKTTSARTEYREIDSEDYAWLQTQMIQWLTIMGQLDQKHDEDSKWVLSQWWHKKDSKKLHKGQEGPNTPCSTVCGILHNMLFKDQPQRDFSNKQMEDLEYVSLVVSQLGDCEAIRFQIGLG